MINPTLMTMARNIGYGNDTVNYAKQLTIKTTFKNERHNNICNINNNCCQTKKR